jgi:uroporphyrinogen-III decarboxylase
MDRQAFLRLAATGHAMPIGADLVLAERPDREQILLDGARLGGVLVEAARRYETPLAVALMDLTVEKHELLALLGLVSSASEADTFHFSAAPDPAMVQTLQQRLSLPPQPRMKANCDALRHVATQSDRVPVGMAIGPFSLTTKLLSDPITAVYLVGEGTTAEEDPEVAALLTCLELSTQIVLRAVRLQAEAGAKAIVICEPAANVVYLSPKQLAQSMELFETVVMKNLRRVKQELTRSGVELIFHDCGELTDDLVRAFATLEPVVMSLGSSRSLPHDATLVPANVVLYGNLPTKKFFSDSDLPIEEVEKRSRELVSAMKRCNHPFILGSECDVLSVPGAHETIVAKVNRMQQVAKEMRASS